MDAFLLVGITDWGGNHFFTGALTDRVSGITDNVRPIAGEENVMHSLLWGDCGRISYRGGTGQVPSAGCEYGPEWRGML